MALLTKGIPLGFQCSVQFVALLISTLLLLPQNYSQQLPSGRSIQNLVSNFLCLPPVAAAIAAVFVAEFGVAQCSLDVEGIYFGHLDVSSERNQSIADDAASAIGVITDVATATVNTSLLVDLGYVDLCSAFAVGDSCCIQNSLVGEATT